MFFLLKSKIKQNMYLLAKSTFVGVNRITRGESTMS